MQPLIKEGCDGGGRGSTEATAIGNVRRSRSCRLGGVGGTHSREYKVQKYAPQ